MPKRKLSPSGKLLVIAMAVWGLFIIVPDFVRVFVDFNKLEIEADNDGRIYRLGPDGQRIPTDEWIYLKRFRIEDVFQRKDVTGLSDLLAVFGGMAGNQYVRPDLGSISLEICTHEDCQAPEATKQFSSFPAPLSPWGRFALLLDELLGVGFIGLSAWLVWHCPSPVTWGFFLYGIWFNPGQYYVVYAELQRWPRAVLMLELTQTIAQAVGYCGLLVFALRFPNAALARGWKLLEWTGLAALAALLAAFQLWSFLSVFGFRTEKITEGSFLLGYLVDVLVICILLVRRFKIESPEDRQRTRWVFWGCAVGLSAFIFADSQASTTLWANIWTPGETFLYFAYSLNAAVAIAVFHAVRKYRVVDVTFALSRSLTRPILWIVFAGILVELNAVADEWLRAVQTSIKDDEIVMYLIRGCLLVGAVILLKFVVDWLHERLIELSDRLLFRRLHSAQSRFASLDREFGRLQTHEELDKLLIEEPATALELQSAAVFRRQEDSKFRQVVPGVGWPEATAKELADHDVLLLLARSSEAARWRIEPDDELAVRMPSGPAFPSLGISVKSQDALSAILLYGAHVTGDDINDEEADLLDRLAERAGAAYERVELAALRRQVEQLKGMLGSASEAGPRE